MRSSARIALAGLAIAPLVAVTGAAAATTTTGSTYQTYTGTLDDGTQWRADIPDQWNGNIFTELDHAGGSLPAWKAFMVAGGHAYIGIERNTTPYEYQTYISNQVDLLGIVEKIIGEEAQTVITVGGSRGGFVARGALEVYPEVFDGAIAMCGGGAGIVSTLNAKLDAVFALKLLAADVVDTSEIELVDISNIPAQMALLGNIVAELRTTPEGRARLALAAAFSQTPDWTRSDQEQPSSRDFEAQLDNIADTFAFGHPAVVRAGVEAAAGGNVSWNHGVDYAKLLRDSGAQQRVRALYHSAGLDLTKDLDLLGASTRISADADALSYAEQNITYSGEIEDPILTLHTIGDPADPLAFEGTYARTLRQAGSNSLLRRVQVERPGHCGFTNAERAAALTTIYERVQTGQWKNSTTPKAMNELASAIDAASPAMGSSAFIAIPQDERSMRPWTTNEWGSYVPAE